ncbi:MAG: hypothetical protein KAW92_13065 [Candidatus Cloacimonetes bacterium]|nr:hypothetical protein [Candidatus Cloacimonadota bacterium]
MIKKIAITAILLGLLTAGSLIAEESLTWTVIIHITADMGIPTEGVVRCCPEGNAAQYEIYHGPDDYVFPDIFLLQPADFVTGRVEAGNHSDEDTVPLVYPITHIYLHLEFDPRAEPMDQ